MPTRKLRVGPYTRKGRPGTSILYGGKIPRGAPVYRGSKLVKMIKAVSRKESLKLQETKFVQSSTGGQQFNSAINTGFNEMYSLIPPLTQETGAPTNFQREDQTI